MEVLGGGVGGGRGEGGGLEQLTEILVVGLGVRALLSKLVAYRCSSFRVIVSKMCSMCDF